MGGPGSGNWFRWQGSKPIVESCYVLDVLRLMHGPNPLRVGLGGTITWSDNIIGEVRAAISFSVMPAGDGQLLELKYKVNDQPVEIPVQMSATRPRFGGRRWWFTCPLVVNNIPCNRRVRKLYLRGRYFGCRKCHDLVYRTSQEAHKAERLFGRLGFDAKAAKLWERMNRGK
jgi:hypothetical protein